MYKPALLWGCIMAALAVMIGAFGAHALKSLVTPDKLLVFDTGVRYHFYHSLALLAVGILHQAYPSSKLRMAAGMFLSGITLFSGSLYAIVLLSISNTSIGPAGIITPIGGLLFITGWIMAAIAVFNGK